MPERTSARASYALAKRFIDIAMAASAIIVLSPLLIAIAIAIRLSGPGPVLFRQVRAGQGESCFKLYKFRTMRHDACDPSGVEQTRLIDHRVTTLGAFLRRTSLDELPQLLNILRGEMSFVGPRPHVPGQLAGDLPYAELVPYYELRRAVPPGLTGWAQANGYRGSTTDARLARDRIDHDIAYIQHASLWLDLRIIALTARDEFLSGNGG